MSEGSHQVASRKATNVDFPGSESDDLRAVARATHVEGRTHGDARGRQSATCAAVGAERATGFQERVRPVALAHSGVSLYVSWVFPVRIMIQDQFRYVLIRVSCCIGIRTGFSLYVSLFLDTH